MHETSDTKMDPFIASLAAQPNSGLEALANAIVFFLLVVVIGVPIYFLSVPVMEENECRNHAAMAECS